MENNEGKGRLSRIDINLSLSILPNMCGFSDAEIVYWALQTHQKNILECLIKEYRAHDNETAALEYDHYTSISEIQNLLFTRIVELAFDNEKLANPEYYPSEKRSEEAKQSLVRDFVKKFRPQQS
jgi:hypothetical protein